MEKPLNRCFIELNEDKCDSCMKTEAAKEMTVYADILFLLNFSLDYICLYAAKKFCNSGGSTVRTVVAAAGGALYSIPAALTENLNIAVLTVMNIAAALLMCFAAAKHGNFKRYVKFALIFISASVLIGGTVTAVCSAAGRYTYNSGIIYVDIPIEMLIVIIVLSSISAFLAAMLFKSGTNSVSRRIKIAHGTKEINVFCLVDSGNLLCDPVSLDPVVLIKSAEAGKLFTESEMESMRAVNVQSESFPQGIKLIPYNRNGADGFFVGFRPTKVFLTENGKEIPLSVVVAIDFSSGTYGGCGGLMPAAIQ